MTYYCEQVWQANKKRSGSYGRMSKRLDSCGRMGKILDSCGRMSKRLDSCGRMSKRLDSWVIPCQIIRFLAIFPRTSSDSFEIWHTCRNCLENNIRQIFFYLGQARSEIWPCEKMEK